jgi:hypothetical protein
MNALITKAVTVLSALVPLPEHLAAFLFGFVAGVMYSEWASNKRKPPTNRRR